MDGRTSFVPKESSECINKKLCLRLLSNMERALDYIEDLDGEAAFPAWVDRLFGGREGLVGAYIRLSQQQLRILAMENDRQKEEAEQNETPLTPEDIALVRSLLAAWEEEDRDEEN